MKTRIVIFGTGGFSNYLSKRVKDDVEIVAYLNTVSKPLGGVSEAIPVIGLEKLQDIIFDYIIIAFSDIVTGFKILEEYGIETEKIVGFSITGYGMGEGKESQIQIQSRRFIHGLLHDGQIPKLFHTEKKEFYLCSMNRDISKGVVHNDYVREQTLALLAEEIKRKNVIGSMAELGVYKGEFSKKMNFLLPDRKLYLFDTFSGFDERDIKTGELTKGEDQSLFDNTRTEIVLNKMADRNMCVIKQGYFPDTFELKDEKFCLVSLDADLYNPLYSGLEIFYPLLSEGGYIMIHDYNNIIYDGAKKAVCDYCDKNKISYVPLADTAGTVVITK